MPDQRQDLDNRWSSDALQSGTRVLAVETVLTVLAISGVLVWALWPFLSTANNTYPNTIDAMGHLTRIKYIAYSISRGQWPAWFPYQDNGSMALQYIPPFSYILLAMVQMLTDNIMITFKSTVFLGQLIGGLGVWYLCRRYIGSWVGIIGGCLYAIQPFLLMSILNIGEVMQIVMFALTPWFLYASLLFFEKMTRFRWLLICLSGTILILAHSMSAFLICIGMGTAIIVLWLRKDISIKPVFFWVLAMALAAGLEAFWGIPSLTHLEHPLMPQTLPELAANNSSAFALFEPMYRNGSVYYAGYAVFLLALGSLMLRKKNPLVIPLLIAALVTLVLSFGPKFPLYDYIPLSDNFIPRKFISFAALAVIILDIVFLKALVDRCRSANVLGKLVYLILLIAMVGLLASDVNPRQIVAAHSENFQLLQQELQRLSSGRQPFEQGRMAPLFSFPSWYFYFAMQEGLNTTHGNMTSTPYTNTNIQNNIAVSSNCPEYVIKNLFSWNTRYVITPQKDDSLHQSLVDYGFHPVEGMSPDILINPAPSSYFMRQERDAIAIGKAAPPLVITYPWMVQGHSATLEDYSYRYLERFKLIYLIEPDVKDFNTFQGMVYHLLDSDKTVVVSLGNAKVWPLAGIIPYWEVVSVGSRLSPTQDGPYKQTVELRPDPPGRAPAMGNLDKVWMVMKTPDRDVPAIGYKTVNEKKLYFVGLNLDKELNATTRWVLGYQANLEHSKIISSLLEEIMDIAHPNKSIVPAAFPVSDVSWEHDGFRFKYNSKQPVSMLVSVTYSRHWRGKLDNQPLQVQQLENLILLDLPAGEHQVSMEYRLTWVGWVGIIISLISLLILIAVYRHSHSFDRFWTVIKRRNVEIISDLAK